MVLGVLASRNRFSSSIDTSDASDLNWQSYDNGGFTPQVAISSNNDSWLASTTSTPADWLASSMSDPGTFSSFQSTSSLSRTSGGGSKTTTPPPNLVHSTTGGNLTFNLIWDSSVGGAGSSEAGFMTAVKDAALFYANNFTAPNQATINLHVGYGEVAGSTIPFGALSASSSEGDYISYATLVAALQAVNNSSPNSLVSSFIAGLPASDPTGQSTTSKDFFVSYAEEKALGLPIGTSGYQTAIDGWIGIAKNSRLTPMDYTDDASLLMTGAMPTNSYDAVSAAAHEISEVMGRISGLGTSLQTGTGATWTALDLARYSSVGSRDLTTKSGYFSLDNGATNLGTYNSSTGDAGDWASNVYDSFGFAHAGVYSPVSSTDIVETAILGYQLTTTAQNYLTANPPSIV
jgi:hypothetical protein